MWSQGRIFGGRASVEDPFCAWVVMEGQGDHEDDLLEQGRIGRVKEFLTAVSLYVRHLVCFKISCVFGDDYTTVE